MYLQTIIRRVRRLQANGNGAYSNIAKGEIWRGKKGDITLNTTQTPVVPVFEVTAGTILIYFLSYLIDSAVQLAGDIKLCRGERIL